MRLWHQLLLPYLDNKRLLAQHRECCALRGKGWGRKHATVDYVFTHSMIYLYKYHLEVMNEMVRRGYNVKDEWYCMNYRGKTLGEVSIITADDIVGYNGVCVYPEHNDAYLKECLLNLCRKKALQPARDFLLSLGNTFFDADVHAAAFTNYCEVVILEDGKCLYATPSHNELVYRLYAEGLHKTVEEAKQQLAQYTAPFEMAVTALNCVVVWYHSIYHVGKMTQAQKKSLSRLVAAECLSDKILNDIL